MTTPRVYLQLAVGGFLSNFPPLVQASELKLAPVFSEHMVFQREMPLPVWGEAAAGETVAVEFAGQSAKAIADANGRWQVKLGAVAASFTPQILTVRATETVSVGDVLVGDVWLCSGQSNMAMSVRSSADADREIAAATHPEIRLFRVPANPARDPVVDFKAAWEVCSPETASGFSAVGYFFGREIQPTAGVPVGLLLSSVGGTPAEAWTRFEALQKMPALAEKGLKELEQWKNQPEDTAKFPVLRAAWEKQYGVEDKENLGFSQGWAAADLDLAGWKKVTLGRSWEQLGFKTGGVFWVRKEVEIPEKEASKAFRLSLLWLDEQYDTVYFNGTEIARGGEAPPEFYTAQRNYQVPAKLLLPGRNVITVRVASASPQKGFFCWGKSMGIPGVNPLSVGEEWWLKQESSFPELSRTALAERPKPNAIAARVVSSALYNGMIAPLQPFGIKGVVWYQGESNAGRAGDYRELLTLIIGDWRAQWKQGDFPFLIQQLVNNSLPNPDPNGRDSWPFLREAQQQVAESLPNCALSAGPELGDPFTIHPLNKQDVGHRLALVALNRVYGKSLECYGPRFVSSRSEGGAIRVTFTHAQGLNAKGGVPKTFAVAGADRRFVWAEAKIEGDEVVVRSAEVPEPVAVRYGWSDNPDACNVYNGSGLPMVPFRTDAWSPPAKK